MYFHCENTNNEVWRNTARASVLKSVSPWPHVDVLDVVVALVWEHYLFTEYYTTCKHAVLRKNSSLSHNYHISSECDVVSTPVLLSSGRFSWKLRGLDDLLDINRRHRTKFRFANGFLSVEHSHSTHTSVMSSYKICSVLIGSYFSPKMNPGRTAVASINRLLAGGGWGLRSKTLRTAVCSHRGQITYHRFIRGVSFQSAATEWLTAA